MLSGEHRIVLRPFEPHEMATSWPRQSGRSPEANSTQQHVEAPTPPTAGVALKQLSGEPFPLPQLFDAAACAPTTSNANPATVLSEPIIVDGRECRCTFTAEPVRADKDLNSK
eukprot:m.412946 g.412946  ORF g.412946 m.412946 type:complete len:113 (+) comp28992_c0_seq1:246-584(+)